MDARSDLWAVGAILYECLTGRPPYTGATYEQVIVNICMNDAEDVRLYNPGVPEQVALRASRGRSRAIARTASRTRASSSTRCGRSRGPHLVARAPPTTASRASAPAIRRSTPISSGRTPSALSRSPQVDAQHQILPSTPPSRFHSTPPPDRLRAHAGADARRRQMFVFVALSALLAGGLGAFVVTRTLVRPSDRSPGHPAPSPPPSAEVPPASHEPARAPAPERSATALPSFEPVVPSVSEAVEPKVKPAKTGHGGPPVTAPVNGPSKAATKPAEAPSAGIAPGLKLKTE